MKPVGFVDKLPILLAIFVCLFSTSRSIANPTNQTVLYGTSDATDTKFEFSATVSDEGKLVGMEVNGSDGSKSVYFLSAINDTNGGVAVTKIDGRTVVKMRGLNIDPNNGGEIEIYFLRNGATGTWGKMQFELDRNGNTWEVYVNNQDGRRKINSLFFRANRFLGKLIGIEKIIAN
ncbi:MAG: hypothetical protein A3K03_04730 [Bdellovibrionales bacterium RIFOXYD1_FULL_44_7]|nr:MAG: hypothetical protein A3K03_04730 [Bdellovibrionales bacterium RIFOXYD1_FULL_44_7]